MNREPDPFDINQQCRELLRSPQYSSDVSAKLIEWLRLPNAAVSDIAGRCLIKIRGAAFDDLLAEVSTANGGLWPNAVWVLAGMEPTSDRMLALLRSWLPKASGDLQRQCVVSLAQVLVARKREGLEPDAEDVATCTRVMQQHLPDIRVHCQDFVRGINAGPNAERRLAADSQ